MSKKKILFSILGLLILLVLLGLSTPSESSVSSTKVLKGNLATIWEAVADVENYEDYATGLKEARILSGSGKGMLRTCTDQVGTWQETCTNWEPLKNYTFEIDTQHPEYPYPFKRLEGSWSVKKVTADQTEVIVAFKYRFNQRWMSWFFDGTTKGIFQDGSETLFKNWQKKVDS